MRETMALKALALAFLTTLSAAGANGVSAEVVLAEPSLRSLLEKADTGSCRNVTFEGREDTTEETEYYAAHVVQPVCFAVMTTILAASLLERCHVHWFPESALAIVLGMLAGLFMRHIIGTAEMAKEYDVLNVVALNMFLLPIIIFESGWSVNVRDFGSQLQYILVFAILGSAVTMVVVAFLLHATSQYHGITDLRTLLAYASLIASTDPVATLATYSSLQVEPLLNIIVFGESLINDAVAIVLFAILNHPAKFSGCHGESASHHFSITKLLVSSTEGILQIFLGSMVLGIVMGVCFIFGLRLARMSIQPSMLCLYMVASAYLTYSTAEAHGCSGIIGTLFLSLTMNLYMRPNMSKSGELLASFFIKQLASLSDMMIFLMVGVDAVLINGVSLQLSLWVMLFCLLGRALAVFPLGWMVNCSKRCKNRYQDDISPDEVPTLSVRHLFMMWHGGLRGGIALVLCLQLGDWVDERNGPGTKQTFINVTVTVVCVFLLVFGGSTQFFLKLLGIPMGKEYPKDYLSKRSVMNCTRRCWRFVDRKIIWPVLVGEQFAEGEELPQVDAAEPTQDSEHKDHEVPMGQMLEKLNALHRGCTMMLQVDDQYDEEKEQDELSRANCWNDDDDSTDDEVGGASSS